VKRLVVFVEGAGDEASIPGLINRLVTDHCGHDRLFIDRDPFKVQSLGKLLKREPGQGTVNWLRWLDAALKRRETGAVLLVLDGDARKVHDSRYVERFNTDEFCAFYTAIHLASIAREAGADRTLSVAVAFAMMEIESWAISVIDQMGGMDLGDGVIIPERLTPPGNPERLRSAKEWLNRRFEYKPTVHQKAILDQLPLEAARERSRSFRRLDNAVRQLIDACRTGNHVCSPSVA